MQFSVLSVFLWICSLLLCGFACSLLLFSSGFLFLRLVLPSASCRAFCIFLSLAFCVLLPACCFLFFAFILVSFWCLLSCLLLSLIAFWLLLSVFASCLLLKFLFPASCFLLFRCWLRACLLLLRLSSLLALCCLRSLLYCTFNKMSGIWK